MFVIKAVSFRQANGALIGKRRDLQQPSFVALRACDPVAAAIGRPR
jgi:hypothetical protein